MVSAKKHVPIVKKRMFKQILEDRIRGSTLDWLVLKGNDSRHEALCSTPERQVQVRRPELEKAQGNR